MYPQQNNARKIILPISTLNSIGQRFAVGIITSSSLPQRFGVTIYLVDESFQYENGWPDTIPDSLISPVLNWTLSETSLSDSFESGDSWP